MAHFYGTLKGSRGEGTRCGTRDGGMTTICASWQGAIQSYAYYNESTGEDWVRVSMRTWNGRGDTFLVYEGPIGRYMPGGEKPETDGEQQ